MSFSLNTPVRNSFAAAFKTAFTNGVIYMYSGAMPTDADAAVQGTLLGKVTKDGGTFAFGTSTNGINWDTPTGGVVSKAAAETWTYTGIADGTVGWCRLMGNPVDALGSSTTLPRCDVAVGASGSNVIVFASTTVTTGVTGNVSAFTFTLPVR